MLAPVITERLNPLDPAAKLLSAQRFVLRTLLDRGRTSRLQAQEAANTKDGSYRVADLLADLRSGIFTELQGRPAKVEPLRRNLQRAYLAQLDERLNATTAPVMMGGFGGAAFPFGNPMDDTRGLVRGELKSLVTLFGAKAATNPDRSQKAHLEELRDLALKALDPKVAPNLPPAPAPFRSGATEDDCWPIFKQP